MDSTAAPDRMVSSKAPAQRRAASAEYDAVVVGASLAGCTTAILLGGRAPASRWSRSSPTRRPSSACARTSSRPRRCRPSNASACSSRSSPPAACARCVHAWTPWGWIEAPPERAARGVNLRREKLDPLIREAAAATPGVELMLGRTVEALLLGRRNGRRRAGARPRRQRDPAAGARSRSAPTAASRRRPPGGAPDQDPSRTGGSSSAPTSRARDRARRRRDAVDARPAVDRGLPDRRRAGHVRGLRDQGPAAGLQARPRAGAGRRSSPTCPSRRRSSRGGGSATCWGSSRRRTASAPRSAPASPWPATRPSPPTRCSAIGCGWALQSAEWLADAVAPALAGAEPLARGCGATVAATAAGSPATPT